MQNKVRFTKENLEKVLRLNEGKQFETTYRSRNFSESCVYTIAGGKMVVDRSGKGSWADSRFSYREECTPETTRRVLHNHLAELDLTGLV